MSSRTSRHRLALGAGSALLLVGLLSLVVPASASAPSLSAPTAGVLKMADASNAPNVRTTTTSTTTTTQPTQGNQGGIVPCPSGYPSTDTCADMPCKAGSYCGQVVAGPTVDLGPDQFVYLNFSGFNPGDNGITVYYCADPGAAAALSGPPPVCGNTGTQQSQPQSIYPSTGSSVLTPGTTEASMQVAEISAPNSIPGQQYHPTADSTSFVCDGTVANACSIVITDATNSTPTSSSLNSVEIPISFAPSTNGCPTATPVFTSSEFGIDVLMPQLARLSCATDPSTAALALETPTDGPQAVRDLLSGQAQIAFTDDPHAADQQAQLAQGHFALIPVALTANVVAFLAQIQEGLSGVFNQDQMDLTPTMAAGLLTTASNYNGSTLTDDSITCSGPSAGGGTSTTCLSGPPCYGGSPTSTCSLYLQLNYVNSFIQFKNSNAFQRADNSGATDQLFNWLCNAPIVKLPFGSNPTETQSAASELKFGLSPANGPPVTTCPANTDQVPSVGGTPTFKTELDPSRQALLALTTMQSSTPPSASFADMNWAEASYYGMNIATLQNAAGNFVQPTESSLDRAVIDATTNPDGTLTFPNPNPDPLAYSMPSVIYAAVSTDPMPPIQAAAVTNLLNQLLQLTSGTEGAQNPSAQLPLGFVPLPQPLLSQAQNAVQADIHAQPPAVTPPSSGSGAPGTSSSSGSNTGNTGDTGNTGQGVLSDSSSIAGDTIGAAGAFSPFVGAILNATTAAAATGGSGHHSDLPLLGPALPAFALAAGHGKAILQVATILGLSALALGVVLMAGGFVSRRRLLRVAPAAVDDAVPDGPSP
jgi:hypothetical protein